MSTHVEWANARNLEVGGSARPGYVVDAYGTENDVACITLDANDRIVIEGRPEELLEKAREILRVAEQIVEVTMRDPELRSLYGLTEGVTS